MKRVKVKQKYLTSTAKAIIRVATHSQLYQAGIAKNLFVQSGMTQEEAQHEAITYIQKATKEFYQDPAVGNVSEVRQAEKERADAEKKASEKTAGEKPEQKEEKKPEENKVEEKKEPEKEPEKKE